MDTFRKRFPSAPTLFAVIHAETAAQVLRNADRALAAGADGLFLINHVISDAALVDCHAAARATYDEAWIGICFRTRSALESLTLVPDSADGLWTGDAGVREDGPDPTALAREIKAAQTARGWRGLHFGGVAFKYHDKVKDPAAMARAAAPYVDVVLTSGDGTGIAARAEKIAAMKHAIGDKPLAVASGISAENVHQYRDIADCFLVASSISDSHSELSAARITELRAAMMGKAR